jgi:hypothetical protein
MKYLYSLFLLALVTIVYGQQYMDTTDPREIKSLLNKNNELNGFGGVDLKVTEIKNNRTIMMGGYGGVLVNHNYQLGVAAYGLITSPEFNGRLLDTTPKDLNLYGGYAGLMIGGIILSKELVHLNFPIILGAGHLQVSDQNFFAGNVDSDFTIEQSAFFVVEPAAQLEFNLTRSLRLAFGVSYRWVEGLDLTNVTDDELIEWNGMVTLKFGRF